MMGNVGGVSQLLETVGVPGPQVGSHTGQNIGQGKDFAAVMQQTADQNGTPLPVAAKGYSSESPEDEAARTAGRTNAAQQASAAEAGGQTKKAAAAGAQSGPVSEYETGTTLAGLLKGLTGKEQVGGTPTLSATVGVVKPDTGAVDMAVKATLPVATVQAAPVAPAVVPVADAVPDAGASVQVASSAKGEAPVVPVKEQMAAAEPAPIVAKRGGKEPVGGVKTPVKATEVKTDSKLTALIPQGTAIVAQTAPVAGTNESVAASVLASVVVPVAVAPQAQAPAPAVQTEETVSSAGMAKAAMTAPTAPVAPVAAKSTAVPLFPGVSAKTVPVAVKTEAKPSAIVAAETSAVPAATPVAVPAGGAAVPAALSETISAVQTAVPSTAMGTPEVTAVKAGGSSGRVGVVANGMPHKAGVVSQATPLAGAEVPAVPPATVAAEESSPVMATAPAALPVATAGATGVAPVAVRKGGKTGESAAAPIAAVTGAGAQTKASSTEGLSAAPVAAASATVSSTVSEGSAAPAAATAHAAPSLDAVTAMTATTGVPVPVAHGSAVENTRSADALTTGAVSVSGPVEHTSLMPGGSLPHTTISSTPTSLEVGVPSGTHGWLKIRAELNAAGEVNASLTGANTAAETKLRGDLPALSSFLQSEKVAMGTIDVRAAVHAAAGDSGSSLGQGSGNGSAGAQVSADAGTGGRAQQQGQPEGGSAAVGGGNQDGDEILPGRTSDAAVYRNQIELDGSEGSPSVGYGAGGSWLNVRA